MREIVFRVLPDRPGRLQAIAENETIHIEADSLEELQHEAREALIERLGPSHVAYRVRLKRTQAAVVARPCPRPLPLG